MKPGGLSHSNGRHAASYVEVLEFSPRPGNKLSVGRLFSGFLSPCRVSTGQHASSKKAMTGATHLISLSLIILL